MRFIFISMLALLPFLGISLKAASCLCVHDESVEYSIDAVPCCQELPESCCVQTNQDPQPKAPLVSLAPQSDSFSSTLHAVTTLTEDRTILRPLAITYSQLARPPPLRSSEHRCQLQSWLL